MSFFSKLFSGENNERDNSESDYLTRAYDSLGDESGLDPDEILNENIETGQPEFWDTPKLMQDLVQQNNDTYTADGDGGDFDVEKNYSENNDNDEEYDEAEIKQSEPEKEKYDEAEAYDSLSDFDGDTAEMDVEAINRAYNEANTYAEQLNAENRSENAESSEAAESVDKESNYGGELVSENAQEAEHEGESLDTDDTFDIDDKEKNGKFIPHVRRTRLYSSPEELLNAEPDFEDEIDKDMLYSAYAPKSMRPKVTETVYYDLDNIEEEAVTEKKKGFKNFVAKHKKWVIGISTAAAVVLVVVLCCVFFFQSRMDPLMGYAETFVTKGNVIKTMAASGNVEPYAKYNITSLVGGTITESPLNAGEEVKAGELVYKIDDTNAQLAVQQAENAVKRAEVSDTSSTEQLKIYANATGVISNLSISAGSTISGGQIATITQANGTEIGLIPNVTGTVESVSVSNGATVNSGQVIATLKSTNSTVSQQGKEIDMAVSQLVLEQAQKDLEKYKIASPIDGVILVKNAKIGDNVTVGQSDEPLMVIADMSKMKFNIEVDELDIWNVKLGQTVIITATALPGETFSGEITNIAGEGEQKGSGVTTYAVEITISDPGKIMSGMNVDAKIIINSAINVLTLPERALYESDGKNALVITDADVTDDLIVDSKDYPNINVPDGYKLVKIEYGVGDGTDVEVVSGLKVGDVVLYKPEDNEEAADLSSSSTKSQSDDVIPTDDSFDTSDTDFADAAEESGENVKSTGKSATQEGLTDLE